MPPRSTAGRVAERPSHGEASRRRRDSLAGAAGRLPRCRLASFGQSDHRPASHAGRARNLQQRRGAVRRRFRRRVSRGEAHAASRICTSAGATTDSIGTLSRSRFEFASGDPRVAGRLRLRSARLQDRRHVLHHVVRRPQRSDDQRGLDARLSARSSGWKMRSCRSIAMACCFRGRSAAST